MLLCVCVFQDLWYSAVHIVFIEWIKAVDCLVEWEQRGNLPFCFPITPDSMESLVVSDLFCLRHMHRACLGCFSMGSKWLLLIFQLVKSLSCGLLTWHHIDMNWKRAVILFSSYLTRPFSPPGFAALMQFSLLSMLNESICFISSQSWV